MRVELRKNTRYHQCRVEFDDGDDLNGIVECVVWDPAEGVWACTCDLDPRNASRNVARLPHCIHFQLLGITSTIKSDPMRVRARAVRLQEQGEFDAEAMLDVRGDEASARRKRKGDLQS